MKKIWLLVSVLFFSACGGGGDVQYYPVNTQTATGTATINIVDVTPSSPKMVAAVLPSGNKARLVFTAPNILGKAYKNIITLDLPVTSPQTIALPAGTQYKLEVISFLTSGAIYKILKYGQSVDTTNVPATFDIVANQNTTVTVAVSEVRTGFALTTTPPGGVVIDNTNLTPTYTVTATIPAAVSSLIRPFWSLNTLLGADFTTPRYQPVPSAVPGIQTTPAGIQSDTFINLQGQFYMNAAYLDTGESQNNFVFFYPDNTVGDVAVKMPVTISKGNVIINIGPL